MFVRMVEGIENARVTNIAIHREDGTFLWIEDAHLPSEKVKFYEYGSGIDLR